MTYRFDGGIEEYVRILNKNKDTLHKEPIYGSVSKDGVDIEFAFQYNDGYSKTSSLCQHYQDN